MWSPKTYVNETVIFFGKIIKFGSLDWLHFWWVCQGSMQIQLQTQPWPVANSRAAACRSTGCGTGHVTCVRKRASATVAPQCLSGVAPFTVRFGPNGLSQSAVNAASGYLFLRTAKCHRLCGDSINQSRRIINNQRYCDSAWPEQATEFSVSWVMVTILKNCQSKANRKQFQVTLQLTLTSTLAQFMGHVPKTMKCFGFQLMFTPSNSPHPHPARLAIQRIVFDELHAEVCTDNCPYQRQIVL